MEDGRGTCGSKAEVSVLDFSKPEPTAILFLWSWCFPNPGEFRRWIQDMLKELRKTAGKTLSKEPRETSSRVLSKTESTNPETSSQVWKSDNQSQRSCGKLQHCAHDHVMHDRSCGKLQQDNAQGVVPWQFWSGPRETASKAPCPRQHDQKVQGVARNCKKKDWKSNCRRSELVHHNLQVTVSGYVEKVFKNLRRKLNRTEEWRDVWRPEDQRIDLGTDVMSTTKKSAIHLGLEHDENFWPHARTTNFEGIKTLFDISLRLVAENSFEILNLSTMMYDFSPWLRMTLCHDQAIKWTKVNVHVYSDPVLVYGKSTSTFRSKHQVERTDS